MPGLQSAGKKASHPAGNLSRDNEFQQTSTLAVGCRM